MYEVDGGYIEHYVPIDSRNSFLWKPKIEGIRCIKAIHETIEGDIAKLKTMSDAD